MMDKWLGADAYEMYVGRWSRKAGRDFLGWLDMPDGLRWLDLGCGTGALTEQIVQGCAPASVTGVEPSQDFLALAGRRITDPRVRFVQGDGETIPLGDGAADCAVSGLVLNFIPDKDRALAELRRCTSPGGTVAAYVWDYAGHAQFMRRFWDAAVALDPGAQALDEGRRFPVCHPDALEALFRSAGLGEVTCAAIDIATPFADFDDYWTPFLSGVGPAPGYCAGLGEAQREALRARLEQGLPTDPDGRILLAARVWAVRGSS
ncbi:methyltransferase domain-containing protein (plasmid) [Salipiger sp. H15]|uniref:Methyltransferase domain-containing protein n=1 Tax=Alloyangia sp. H15 TaxID=3029062 RepID=A0AAU8AR21_9RHOB